jgi:RTX calcium-binding nonapeptide repeat (4 copies)
LGGNDRISGFGGADTLQGGLDRDTLLGGDGGDRMIGSDGNDALYGENGDDEMRGNKGDDLVVGGLGSDRVFGGDGMDTLVGAQPDTTQPGLAEIDELTGYQGADTFILGDALTVYYDDGDEGSSGWNDYGLVQSFNGGEDIIQLSGRASDYFLAASPSGLPAGTAIFRETGNTDDLIGIVGNVRLSQLNLTSSSFRYV